MKILQIAHFVVILLHIIESAPIIDANGKNSPNVPFEKEITSASSSNGSSLTESLDSAISDGQNSFESITKLKPAAEPVLEVKSNGSAENMKVGIITAKSEALGQLKGSVLGDDVSHIIENNMATTGISSLNGIGEKSESALHITGNVAEMKTSIDSLFKHHSLTANSERAEVDAQLFPWKKKKKKEDDCDDDSDWPKKILYVKFGLEKSEPIYFKESSLPSQNDFINKSSIREWFEKFLNDCQVEEEDDDSVYDEKGRIIFIALTNKNLAEQRFMKQIKLENDLSNVAQLTSDSQNVVFISFDDDDNLNKAELNNTSLRANSEVHAQFSLREAVEQLKKESKEIDPCDKDFENDVSYHDEPIDCERFIFVSWSDYNKLAKTPINGTINKPSESKVLIIDRNKTFVQDTNQSWHERETKLKEEEALSHKYDYFKGFGFHKGYGNNQITDSASQARLSMSLIAALVFVVSCV